MLKHRLTDRICCTVLVAMLLLTTVLTCAAATGAIEQGRAMGYENRLFDQSRIHSIEIVMDDWEGFLETCTNEEYAACTVVIDGESYKNVGIRAKGNTSLSSVQSYGNNRYSFKIEFDQYSPGNTYHGLDKLSLNNVIQDNTYLKDYLAYTLMNEMDVAAPLCSFVNISVNGELWGTYLAVEAVEDSFLQRNYGSDYGELYKPDSMSFGGGRGNGRDFDMDEFTDAFASAADASADSSAPGAASFDPSSAFLGGMPDGMTLPEGMGNFDPASIFSGDMPEDITFPESMEGFDPASIFSGEMPEGMTLPEGMKDFDSSSIGMGGMGSSDVRLQYTDDDPDSYSNIFNNAKTSVTETDQQRLIASLKAMNEGDTSAVDVNAVIRYLVVHNFMCNDDSYTGMMVHNYYLYEEDGVLSMIPWDYNLAMGAFSGGFGGSSGATSTVNSPIDSPVSQGDVSSRPMVAWIFESEEYTALYHEIYAEFIDKIFASGWFEETLDSVLQILSPCVEEDPTAFCTYAEFETAAETLREFCLLRAQSVTGQLDGTIPSTTDGQRAASGSLIDASHISISDMGSMGNMGGGNMGGKGGNANGFGGRDAFRGSRSATGDSTSADGAAAAEPDFSVMPGGNIPGGMSPGIPQTDGDAAVSQPDPGAFSTDAQPSDENPAGTLPESARTVGGGDFSQPGAQFPDGDMPEGMSLPEEMTPPDGASLPAGMTPGAASAQGEAPVSPENTAEAPAEPSDNPADPGQSASNPASAPETTAQAPADPAEDQPRQNIRRGAMADGDVAFPAETTGSDSRILLAASAILLVAGICFARIFKSHF